MRLTAEKNADLDDDYIHIKYREMTPTINKIFQICQVEGSVLLCEKDEATHRVDVGDVLYIEWVDSRSCIYTKDHVLTIPSSLAQLEEALSKRNFIRISKSTLVNIWKIQSVASGLNFKLTAELLNGEKVVVSRHYRAGLLSAINTLAKEVGK
ncbi:MAG: LytTR family transcriptional regulator [Defluviitaleaceae bacterium]|nr:LytTR family transcriptional regulator [Defluviitaleaceae bacterium]